MIDRRECWQPYQLVSLWDMLQKFDVEKLITAIRLLESWSALEEGDLSASALKSQVREKLPTIKLHLSKFDLGAIDEHYSWILETLKSKYHVVETREAISQLVTVIEHELRSSPCYTLSRDCKVWMEAKGVSDIIKRKFEEGAKHLDEACKCYALGRDTATAFHSLCAMDRALPIIASLDPSLRHHFKKNLEFDSTWGKIVNELDDKVLRWKKTAKTKRRKAKIEFLAGVLSRMRAINVADRIPYMHGQKLAREGEAKDILVSSMSLLEHIAKGHN